MTGWRYLKWVCGASIACGAIVLVPAIGIWGKDANTRGPIESTGPLISRGYTDVRAESALVAGDPQGGELVADLKVRAGDFVRKGQVLALLSNAPAAELDVVTVKANLERARSLEQSMLSGFRRSEVELQEAAVRLAETNHRLKALELSRTTLAPDEREVRLTLLSQKVEEEKAKLAVSTQRLAFDLAGQQTELRILEDRLAEAEYAREQALVRAPLDGVVIDVLAHTGELAYPRGIVRITDLQSMRIYADVDEVHLGKLKEHGKVEFTVRGDTNVYDGRISRLPSTVKRTKMSEADFGESTSRLAEVEIEPVGRTDMAKLIGRETRITFR